MGLIDRFEVASITPPREKEPKKIGTLGGGGGKFQAGTHDARDEILALGHHGEGGEQPTVPHRALANV